MFANCSNVGGLDFVLVAVYMRNNALAAPSESELPFFVGGFRIYLVARFLAKPRPIDVRIVLLIR